MLVEYPAETMYSLVDDVARYPEFLPWCGGAEILSRDDQTVHAALQINYKGIKQRFSTRNRAQAPKLIEITLIEGPFRHGASRHLAQKHARSSLRFITSFRAGCLISWLARSLITSPILSSTRLTNGPNRYTENVDADDQR